MALQILCRLAHQAHAVAGAGGVAGDQALDLAGGLDHGRSSGDAMMLFRYPGIAQHVRSAPTKEH